ncbi:hypothetical protein ABPG75_009462 [Micractinium tetrahymenae]
MPCWRQLVAPGSAGQQAKEPEPGSLLPLGRAAAIPAADSAPSEPHQVGDLALTLRAQSHGEAALPGLELLGQAHPALHSIFALLLRNSPITVSPDVWSCRHLTSLSLSHAELFSLDGPLHDTHRTPACVAAT